MLLEEVKKQKKNNKRRIIISICLITVGLCLTFYSFIANTINDRHNSTVLKEYNNTTKQTDKIKIKEMLNKANKYNESLKESDIVLTDPFETNNTRKTIMGEYNKLLNLGNNVLCYADIPCINVNLPVYHGTSDDVLNKGAGHIEGTSLPVGGKGTHAVIAAHSGLNTAKMFSDLELMKINDVFYIHCLNKTMAYRVDKINVVFPEDISQLVINQNEDYVTLLTCTPYGINDHRLLVRGKRTEFNNSKKVTINKRDSIWLKKYKQILKIGFSVIATIIIVILVVRKIRGIKNEKKK